MNSNSNTRSPYCPHCANLGLVSNTHFLRKTPDKNSPVVCPILLNTECKQCGKLGHTVSFCKMERKPVGKPVEKKVFNVSKKVSKVSKDLSNNRFALFDDEMEEGEIMESVDSVVPVRSIPVVPTTPAAPVVPVISYASVTASAPKLKPKPIIIPEPIMLPEYPPLPRKRYSNWADDSSDSDSE
jgi:hypothetical protein